MINTMRVKKLLLWMLLGAVVFGGMVVLIWMWVANDGGSPEKTPPNSIIPTSFTLFGLGPDTQLTKQVRLDLKALLGAGGYAEQTPIDLELHFKGFLKTHFPRLDTLNAALNNRPGERVEHHTIQLTYRYARKQNTPFDYVQLV
ncbi:MAG: hypothetical protein JRH15_20700, partial [Deltaproteobacteria bacterium]|nr:hypothetical protein [Deltaproteobacteria bacterium]